MTNFNYKVLKLYCEVIVFVINTIAHGNACTKSSLSLYVCMPTFISIVSLTILLIVSISYDNFFAFYR